MANVFALKSVLNAVKKKNVDRLMIAGDFIGYYFWPAEVFNLLKDCGIWWQYAGIMTKCLSGQR